MLERSLEAVTASMVRSHEVMLRQLKQYDYEKVFWNSVYGVGLFGLGWVAVKLGFFIRNFQKAFDVVMDPVRVDPAIFRLLFDWVEGDKSGWRPGYR